MMPIPLQAGLWGLLAGSSLLLGAVMGMYLKLSARTVAFTMAFGSGVLISALSFELMEEAIKEGGLYASSLGFALGAVLYSGANGILSRWGARHRKRSGAREGEALDADSSGLAITVGAMLDGIPESIAIGLSLLSGGVVSSVTVAAIFISNVPEGLSSSAGMRKAGHSAVFVFVLWTVIALVSGVAACAGASLFGHASPAVRAGTSGLAAGGILAMVVETMIPEAFAETHELAGLVAGAGFLSALALRTC